VARRYSLRASDSDRDEVVERLRAATAEGRLRVGELEQRLEDAFRARTYGELDALVADLPAPPARAPLPARRRPGLPVLAGATLSLGITLSMLDAVATTGYERVHAGVDGHAGAVGLLGVVVPLIVIVSLVVVCAALGWLFSQSSNSADTAPDA
jgi:Domain of unknown function (DUF1707)